jgi:hypothetical protein
MDADARPDTSSWPPATSASTSDSVTSSDPPDGVPRAGAWQARRQRRRDRRRARLATEALDHDPDDEDHWRETARRHAREAIRKEVRRGMLAPWHDEGAGGLRIIIDLGMESLMNDAELKSLVTQIQLSYAAALRLTVDEIIRRANARPYPSADPTATDAVPSSSADPGALRVSARLRAAAAASLAVRAAGHSCAPTRLMLSSLDGRAEAALRRDAGSAAWPVRASREMFELAARRAASGEDPGAAPEGSDPSKMFGGQSGRGRPDANRQTRIVVMSPDAEFALEGAPDRDAVYVVGGLCDYKRIANATLDRAEAAGVEARRLPIEESFGANFSVNILTVNQTVEALCRAGLNGGDWEEALRGVLPARKMASFRGGKGVGGVTEGGTAV